MRSHFKSDPLNSTLATDPDSTLDLTQEFTEESGRKASLGGTLVTTADTKASSPTSQTVVGKLKRKATEVRFDCWSGVVVSVEVENEVW